jgi:plasmid maintenance system killer protein
MQLVRFRHRGLGQFYEEGNARSLPSAMAEKLSKLLFAMETAPAQGRPQGILEPDRNRKLAIDLPL